MATANLVQQAIDAQQQLDARVRPLLGHLLRTVGRLRMPAHNRALARELTTVRDELVAAHDEFLQMLDGHRDATQVLVAAVITLQRQLAALEQENAALRAAERAWQREYEPDADPDRPSFFSNLRHAFLALRFR